MADAGKLIEWSELMKAGAQGLEDERFAEACRAFDRAVELGRQMGQQELLSFSLRMQGMAHNRLGNFALARKALSESLGLARQAGNLRGQGEALCGLANVAYALDETAVAEDLFHEALEMFVEDRLRKAMVLCDLGVLYCNASRWEKASTSYHQALVICRELKEKHGEAEILVMLGELSRRRGCLEESALYLKDASMVFATLQDWRSLASTLQYLGLAYHDLGDLEKASESHRRALALWLDLGETEEVALVLFALGKLAQALDRLEEAEDYFLHSLDIVKDDPEASAYRHQNLGNLYLLRKNWEKAEENFKAALDLFTRTGKLERTGEMLETLGFLQEIAGDSKQAESYYLQALQVFNSSGSKKGLGEVYRTLGLLYEEAGRHKRALENLWRALNFYRELNPGDALQVEKEIQRISRRIRRERSS